MGRISSSATFWYKRIFPIVWFGVLAVIAGVNVLAAVTKNQIPEPMLLIVPAIMAFFGFLIMRKMIFGMVDEVVDEGDVLLVRNNHHEERIQLSDIVNVSYSPYMNPPLVALTLRHPSIFGDTINFCAPVRFMPFSTSPVIDELIRRIDAKRGGGGVGWISAASKRSPD